VGTIIVFGTLYYQGFAKGKDRHREVSLLLYDTPILLSA